MCLCISCASWRPVSTSLFFFFNDTATTEIYTLSLHDALPICPGPVDFLRPRRPAQGGEVKGPDAAGVRDRKSTRLNSSHGYISYAVFCLKKKKTTNITFCIKKKKKIKKII